MPDEKQGFGNEGQVNNPSPQTQGVNSQGYKTMSMGFNAEQDTNNINSDQVSRKEYQPSTTHDLNLKCYFQGLNRTDTAGNEKPIASKNQFRVQGSRERIVKQPQIQHGRDANFDQHRVLHKNITHEKE